MMLLWWKLVGVAKAIPTKLVLIIGVIGGTIASLLAWRKSIIASQETKAELHEYEQYIEVQERIHEALKGIQGNDLDDARKWLLYVGNR